MLKGNEKLPTQYPLPVAVRIYAKRLAIILLIATTNLLLFGFLLAALKLGPAVVVSLVAGVVVILWLRSTGTATKLRDGWMRTIENSKHWGRWTIVTLAVLVIAIITILFIDNADVVRNGTFVAIEQLTATASSEAALVIRTTEQLPETTLESLPTSTPDTTVVEALQESTSTPIETTASIIAVTVTPTEAGAPFCLNSRALTIDPVAIRRGPSLRYNAVGSLQLGESLCVTGRTLDDLWYSLYTSNVNYPGGGWVPTNSVRLEYPHLVYTVQPAVLVTDAYLWTGPGSRHVIATLRQDTIIPILDKTSDNAWYLVHLVNGWFGWVESAFVEFLEPVVINRIPVIDPTPAPAPVSTPTPVP